MYINLSERQFTEILNQADLESIPEPQNVVKATSDNKEQLKKLQDELRKAGFKKVNFS